MALKAIIVPAPTTRLSSISSLTTRPLQPWSIGGIDVYVYGLHVVKRAIMLKWAHVYILRFSSLLGLLGISEIYKAEYLVC